MVAPPASAAARPMHRRHKRMVRRLFHFASLFASVAKGAPSRGPSATAPTHSSSRAAHDAAHERDHMLYLASVLRAYCGAQGDAQRAGRARHAAATAAAWNAPGAGATHFMDGEAHAAAHTEAGDAAPRPSALAMPAAELEEAVRAAVASHSHSYDAGGSPCVHTGRAGHVRVRERHATAEAVPSASRAGGGGSAAEHMHVVPEERTPVPVPAPEGVGAAVAAARSTTPMKRGRWSLNDERKLLGLVEDGLSLVQMADTMRRSVPSCRSKLLKLLDGKNVDPEVEARMRAHLCDDDEEE